MDAKVREYLSRANQAALEIAPSERGSAEWAVLSLWEALAYAMVAEPTRAQVAVNDLEDYVQRIALKEAAEYDYRMEAGWRR